MNFLSYNLFGRTDLQKAKGTTIINLNDDGMFKENMHEAWCQRQLWDRL